MFKLPFFSKKRLLLAFEYGVILATVAKERGIELTPEIVVRCEDIIQKEFSTKSFDRVALDMIPNLLASIESK